MRFVRNGWRFTSPLQLSVDYRLYRDYIRRSKGEFSVAKDQYVRLNTGWFSDRSVCYLAAGRPVILQETGFSKHYGNSGGLFAFSSLAEIVEAVKTINADYKRHSRAARSLVREVFEAEKVLASLLDRAGV
jgi:glycosyltransferase involved in cell wall biosynthesis